MDPLTELLDSPRVRGAFLLRVTMSPPWAVAVRDEAPLTVMAVTSGTACYQPADAEVVDLQAGDVVLARGPAPYDVADRAGRAPQAVIGPGGVCETPTGESLELPLRHGVRSWGNAADGRDALVVGTYARAGEVGARLLAALPTTVLVPAGRSAQVDRLVGLLTAEVPHDGLGQAALLDRLLDALTVAAVRAWCASPEAGSPTWLHGGGDDLCRRALTLLHDRPAAPWTVAALAHELGLSRAGLARRFADGVGQPPMAYLSDWRLALAADRLRAGDETVAAISRAVGYTSPFTFSAAFKRRYGVSPAGWRRSPPPRAPHVLRSGGHGDHLV